MISEGNEANLSDNLKVIEQDLSYHNKVQQYLSKQRRITEGQQNPSFFQEYGEVGSFSC